MKKIIAIACVVLLSSFLEAKPLFTEYKTTLLEVNGKDGSIADSADFVVGSSGIIIHKFDAKTTSIVSRFDVIGKNAGKATLRFETFEMLSQSAFPSPALQPVAGDEVIVNYLYNRSLIVTPNQSVYTEVTRNDRETTWIHPDVVAGYLTKLYRPNPDKTIFQKACYQNTASLIFFAIKDKGYYVDCYNFNTIHTINVTASNETELPFYARIKNIDSSWFSWDSKQIGDYNAYYSTLIRK